jgi:hypothetical protein
MNSPRKIQTRLRRTSAASLTTCARYLFGSPEIRETAKHSGVFLVSSGTLTPVSTTIRIKKHGLVARAIPINGGHWSKPAASPRRTSVARYEAAIRNGFSAELVTAAALTSLHARTYSCRV